MTVAETTQQQIDYWTQQVSISMSRSQWQFIQMQLLLRGTDRRLKQEKQDANWKYSKRIGNAIK
jgi:hypothetical protein